MWEKIKNWCIDFALNGGATLLKGVLVLVIGLIAVKIILNIITKAFAKSKMEKITQSFLMSIIKFSLYVLLILIVASTLGIPTTGVVALLTACTLAISLSLQDSISNLANGIVIITTKPFKEGDYVSIEGNEGKVRAIKMLTTTIVTNDNKVITIPNSNIVTNEIINYSTMPTRRVDFNFDVAYESDIKKVKEIIEKVIYSDGRVILNPKPFISLKSLDSSSIRFFANCWVDSADYWDVYYYVINSVFNEFKKENISIPYNQLEVRMRDDNVIMPVDTTPLQERVEKERKVEEKHDILDIIKLPHKNKKQNKKQNKKKKIEKEDK